MPGVWCQIFLRRHRVHHGVLSLQVLLPEVDVHSVVEDVLHRDRGGALLGAVVVEAL